MEALVVNVRHGALDDGPGLRTLVFFKGCPLRCVWCHNPETQRSFPELMFDPDACIACGDCARACGPGAIDLARSARIDREACTRCMDCAEACPSGALKAVGTLMTVEDLERQVLLSEPFYRHSGGGVTYSGGEPTVHLQFLAELAPRLHDRGIHQALETCGVYRHEEVDRRLLPFMDLVYFDVKFIDDALHERYTGRPARPILDNLERLLGRSSAPVLVRVPLVPGVTATAGNLGSIAAFLKARGVRRVELLEYNPTWHKKAAGLGHDIACDRRTFLTDAEKTEAGACFDGFDLGRFSATPSL